MPNANTTSSMSALSGHGDAALCIHTLQGHTTCDASSFVSHGVFFCTECYFIRLSPVAVAFFFFSSCRSKSFFWPCVHPATAVCALLFFFFCLLRAWYNCYSTIIIMIIDFLYLFFFLIIISMWHSPNAGSAVLITARSSIPSRPRYSITQRRLCSAHLIFFFALQPVQQFEKVWWSLILCISNTWGDNIGHVV